MIKAILCTLYIAAVLLFSAFARAEMMMPFYQPEPALPVQVDSVQVDEVHLALNVAGRLPNPCTPEPTAQLSQDSERPNVLIVRLSSPIPQQICISPVANYQTVVHLPEIAQSARLPIDDKSLYLVKVEGAEFEMVVFGSQLMRVPGFIAQ